VVKLLRVFFLVVSTLLRGHTVIQGTFVVFPWLTLTSKKIARRKKTSTTGGCKKRALPKCLQTRNLPVKIIVDDLIGGGGFQSDPKTESALEEVVDNLIGGGGFQRVFKHEACL